ncbi:MAG TPA: hypothetical protein VGR66_11985, partial [Candidatus Eisenbacteria bacterium]|nr:hypothetical protein [Candidatus Eisenbacteria bacterium]
PDLPNDIVVDQQALAYPGSEFSFLFYAPTGQEFVPQQASLDVVEMQATIQAGATMRIRIHEDTITGPVVATSRDGTTAYFVIPPSFLGFQVTRFLFDSPVPLVPGNRYVMEIFDFPSGAVLNGGIFGDSHDEYPWGRCVILGDPRDDGLDLWFREGTLATVPAHGPTWASVKARYATPRP